MPVLYVLVIAGIGDLRVEHIVLLMVVLGLTFVRVLHHAGGNTPGFETRGIDLATIDVSVASLPDEGRLTFWPTLLERVRQTPAVEAASLARVPPGGWEGIGLVRLTLATLDERSRELIRLKFTENLSYKEIAARTGLTSGHVGYLLHHAIKTVGDELAKTGVKP